MKVKGGDVMRVPPPRSKTAVRPQRNDGVAGSAVAFTLFSSQSLFLPAPHLPCRRCCATPRCIRHLEYDPAAGSPAESFDILTVTLRVRLRMESRPLRLGGLSQLFPEFLPESRVPRVEIICPQPCRAVKVNFLFDCVASLGSKAKCVLPACLEDHNNSNFLNVFLNKDEFGDGTSNQTDFFCGSPPVRTNNPVVWDALFTEGDTSIHSCNKHE